MEKIQIGIESLVKGSASEPWKITFLTPVTNIRMTATLGDGGVEVGPRFSEVLASIERNQVYPRTITGRELDLLGMATRDSFVVKMLSDAPAHIEIGFRPFRQFRNPAKPQVKGTNEEVVWEPEEQEEEAVFSALMNVPNDGGGSSRNTSTKVVELDYLLVGRVLKVKDGDTIDFLIEAVGNSASKEKELKEGNKITIRIAGINTPETKNHGVEQGMKRNAEYVKKYGVTDEQAFAIGEEALRKLDTFLNGKDGKVVIDLDASINGMPKKDMYGRYVAAVYKTDFTDTEDAFLGEFTAPNLSKVMLNTRSVTNSKAPLAMPYEYFIDNEYSRLAPVDWLYDVGIRVRSQEKVGARIKREANKKVQSSHPLEDGTIVDGKIAEAFDNQIDFMEAYDDRAAELFPEGSDHRVRIGDVMLVIPPLAIDVNRVSNIQKVKTLRSKASMMTRGTSSVTTLTLQLYFHDLDSINGCRVKMHKDLDRYYYMDGLRPLIAQFKKAPFVPIDNQYINETLGIDSVALVNLNVQSVPGFPHSIAASLTLVKFEHEAYMPQLSRLAEGMNYPMFRWYYQEPLKDVPEDEKNPYRTWLSPIPSEGLTNDFRFMKVAEEHLIARKDAIENLRNLTNPLIMEERFMNPRTTFGSAGNGSDTYTLLGKVYKDGVMAQKVIDQYDRYMKLKKAKKLSTKRDSLGYVPASDKITIKGYNDDKWEWAFKEIYGEGKVDADVLKVSHYAPFESFIHNMTNKKGYKEDVGGIFKLRMYAQSNIELFNEDYYDGKDGELHVYLVPATEIAKIRKMIERGKQAEDSYLEGIEKWNKAKAAVEISEGHLELEEHGIGGELIPTSVSIMYENQFSSAQLQGQDGPTLQFLGGQDPYISVAFEADEFAVQDIRILMEETERYAREYRVGITSGFLGVENHLMQLFGVTTVMPETVQVRTVPGFPGRYQVEMSLVGFNKTQKRSETLEGISPIYGDTVDRESREVSKYDPSQDESIIYYKMRNMELYPDLELPTYDDLVSVLPYLDAKCTVYENRTGGIYLDPDFYMSTPITVRKLIDDERYQDQSMEMSDYMGIKMTTSSTGSGPLDGSPEMWDLLRSIDSRAQQINPSFSWSGEASEASGGTSNSETISFANKDVEAYVKDRESLKKAPSFSEWVQMGMGSDHQSYEYWKNNKLDPGDWEVYREIYKWVDALWVKEGLVFHDRDVDTTNELWRKNTYADSQDLMNASWNSVAMKSPEYLKGKEKQRPSGLSDKEFKAVKSKITRERIANIIKAVFHERSKWKQMHSSGMPILDQSGNAAGIGGVPLSSEASSIFEAKKLLWNWKYNLEVAIKHLFEGYQAAYSKKDIEYRHAPWEWMLVSYATGSIESGFENSFRQRVTGVLNGYYSHPDKMYASPTSFMSLNIMQQKNGFNSHEMGVIKGDKAALIQELLDTGFRRIVDKKEQSKADTKTWLEKLNPHEVVNIYEKYLEHLLEKDTVGDLASSENKGFWRTASDWLKLARKGPSGVISSKILDKIDNNSNRDTYAENAAMYDTYMDVHEYIDNAENSRLVNQSSPTEVFPEMFTDMVQYDHKMRLVRAFPTFQMFIVDEGKWMSNYRLWDNLYGFNAIQSIDIHKSRKMAADTAVIQMTNVYSNLTSRSLDTTYEEWDYKFWDNLVFGNPNEKLLEARKELLSSLLLQTGARVHLRIGYGSSANDLPVVFNGTITEMGTGDVVTLVCQGDGLELGNVISGDPDDDNKSFFKITEPRDLICKLMTSKGNWFKDAINYGTGGKFFRDNPLGVQHFGQPGGKITPEGNWKFFNTEYGESAQNIYSSNGMNTFSQWVHQDGEPIEAGWGTKVMRWLQPGDEDNVVVSFYNNTIWDIVQTLAYCSTDYIAAVHPFEMRSTLFFGKPYWRMAYTYESQYIYHENQKAWQRIRNKEYRKPYSQFHIFDSSMDIIKNDIKASEEGVYTNVIVNYDGKQTPVIYADWDIRFDKQKTTVIDAEIVSRNVFVNFWTAELQAMYYGISAVRDYMKDMYKGELVVLGSPTLKPHDICYMQDTMINMNGNFMVKAVTHHFSQETGFITSIQPDVLAVSDDVALLSVSNWSASLAVKFLGAMAGYRYGARVIKKLIPSHIATAALKIGGSGATRATQVAIAQMANFLPDGDSDVGEFKKLAKQLRDIPVDSPKRAKIISEMQEKARVIEGKLDDWDKDGMFVNEQGKKVKGKGSYARTKRTVTMVKSMTQSLTAGKKAFKIIRWGGMALLGFNPLSLLAGAAITWVGEGVAETYRRKKATMQSVIIMPLNYQGRQYTAGINGHKGMVVGDPMGKLDSFLSGMGLDGENGNEWHEWAMDTWNWLTDAEGKDFSITEEDLRNGLNNKDR